MLEGRTCPACRERPPSFTAARSLFLYRGPGARVVHALKYEQGTWLCNEIRLLLEMDPALVDFFRGALLVPVPLHPSRLRWRGYNQAAVVAAAVLQENPDCQLDAGLVRVRRTTSQTFLSREERCRNMAQAFSWKGRGLSGQEVVLVDDVLTTGATLNAATGAILAAGASRVRAFTLAHG